MKKYLIAIVVIIALALIAWRSGKVPVLNNLLPAGDSQPVACTMEAKQCPDGSYVGRTGPKCEFKECPEMREIIISELGIILELPKDLFYDLTYAVTSDKYNKSVSFSSERLQKLSNDCDPKYGPIGSISKKIQNPNLSGRDVRLLNGVYYYFQGAQALCTDSEHDTGLQSAQLKSLSDNWKKFKIQ
ncbi:MAG: hypothetical protein NTY66_04230 [Candidatus Vogelbacteria bacterium]|nr:hypothetical protein [Candidatus Vogelbacteria bacterium]